MLVRKRRTERSRTRENDVNELFAPREHHGMTPAIGAGPGPGCAAVVSVDGLYQRAADGLPCWVSDSAGGRRVLPVHRWFGGAGSNAADRAVDRALLQACTGPTLDLGCGPGRLTGALTARGIPALGVDISAAAVRMTIRRGGMALHQDIFAPLPGLGSWAQVLLADGNIGIGGDPTRVLRRARQLLGPDGIVLVELDPPSTGVRRERLRLETERAVGAWFPWARVGTEAAADLAAEAGLRLLNVTELHGRFITRMKLA